MEFIPGVTADKFYQGQFQNMSAPKAITLLENTLATLDAIHKKGILHRDIKPSNIVIHENTSEPWIFDFAKEIVLVGRGGNTLVGTAVFSAPEIKDGIVGPYSDIFSLGATILACTGLLADNDTCWDDVLAKCPFNNELKTIITKNDKSKL